MESFSDLPLQNAIPAYVYTQFADDADIQAFFTAHNTTAQEYVDWFNNTPFGAYTSPGLFGPLLDWIATALYGVERPVVSNQSTAFLAGFTAFPVSAVPLTGYRYTQNGTATVGSDDLYKRVLTWILYRGDGQQMTMFWLQKRIARFLYGANGSDVPLSTVHTVSVGGAPYPFRGAMGLLPMGLHAMGMGLTTPGYRKRSIAVALPPSSYGTALVDLIASGILPIPFQMRLFFTNASPQIGSTFIIGQSQVG